VAPHDDLKLPLTTAVSEHADTPAQEPVQHTGQHDAQSEPARPRSPTRPPRPESNFFTPHALVTIVVLGGLLAAAASASWSSQAGAGPLTVSTGTVDPPSGLAAARNCVRNAHNWVRLTWTATPSAFADGYQLFRALGAGTPVSIATISGGGAVTYTDKSVNASRTYSYTIQATYLGWRSTISNTATITTPNNRCQ
jgi:hypothetical protein